jgi:DNA-binding transcriptional regulator YiaG
MSRAKKARKPMRSLDPVLAQKISDLRNQLHLNQAQFAEVLNVTRTQIGEWEKGTKERPSTEKMLAMAQIAPTR